jgi:hypothetical protein
LRSPCHRHRRAVASRPAARSHRPHRSPLGARHPQRACRVQRRVRLEIGITAPQACNQRAERLSGCSGFTSLSLRLLSQRSQLQSRSSPHRCDA